MEKVVLLLSVVFVWMVYPTYTLSKDDNDLLQSLTDYLHQMQKIDARINNKRKLSTNDIHNVDQIKRDNKFRTRVNSKTPKYQNGQDYFVRFPEQQPKNVNKDEGLYRAIDAFLHAERARQWATKYPYKGTSTTTTPAPTPPSMAPTTASPTTSEATTTTTTTEAPTTKFPWCRRSWFWGNFDWGC